MFKDRVYIYIAGVAHHTTKTHNVRDTCQPLFIVAVVVCVCYSFKIKN